MNKEKITFYGGADTVTGSNFMLTLATGENILIDCGLVQGSKEIEKRNWLPFGYDSSQVSTLLVTHAHMDHIGLIGKLVAEGFKGEIYSTEPTKALARVMLDDGLHIMQEEARRNQIDPLWGEEHLKSAFSRWNTVDYHHEFSPKGIDSISVSYIDAGHILGSALVRIKTSERKITFSGDLGNSPSVLLPNTEVPDGSDIVLMEAVYGNRNHQEREGRRERLRQLIQGGIDRGGPIIIPAFSLERTQMLLYELNELVEGGELPAIPVFLDSPLAIRVLDVYEKYSNYFNERAKADIKSDDDIFRFPGLKISRTTDDSKAIKYIDDPKIIIAGSGMSHAGRVIAHERDHLGDPKTTLLFIGYQAPGTFGRKLLEGKKRVRIRRRNIKVRADIQSLLSYSSHKDMRNLIDFAEKSVQNGTKEIAIVLSEPGVALSLAKKLQDLLANTKIRVPERGEVWELH